MGSVVQIVMLIVDILIYYPFFKLLDQRYMQEESAAGNEGDELDDLSFDDLELD